MYIIIILTLLLALNKTVLSQEVSSETKYKEITYREKIKKNKINTIKVFLKRTYANNVLDRYGLNSEYEYDKKGRPLKEISYDSSGNIEGYHYYNYDEDTLLEEKEFYPFRPEIKRTTSYKYDEKGKLIERTVLSDIDPTKESFLYDSTNKLVKSIYCTYDICGRTSYYEYDSLNQLVKEEIRGQDSSLIEEYVCRNNGKITTRITYNKHGLDSSVYIYNDNKDQIEYVVFDQEGNIERREVTTRNVNGYWIDYTEYEGNEKIIYFKKREFDANNNITKEEKYKYGALTYRIKSIFDTNGNVVKRDYENLIKLTKYEHTYKYDKNGFIKKMTVFDPNQIIKKYYYKYVYEYYE